MVLVRRAGVQREAGLVVDVKKEDRQRSREDDRGRERDMNRPPSRRGASLVLSDGHRRPL